MELTELNLYGATAKQKDIEYVAKRVAAYWPNVTVNVVPCGDLRGYSRIRLVGAEIEVLQARAYVWGFTDCILERKYI